ncbi:hypothetical protein ACVWW6_000147 [Bradyrhizobium sp. USDA 3311]
MGKPSRESFKLGRGCRDRFDHLCYASLELAGYSRDSYFAPLGSSLVLFGLGIELGLDFLDRSQFQHLRFSHFAKPIFSTKPGQNHVKIPFASRRVA